MSEIKEGTVSLTEPVVSTFPNLLEAKSVMKNGKPTGDPKYSHNYEFEPTSADLAMLKAEALKVAKAKWPGRAVGKESATRDDAGNPKQPTFVFPFSSGDILADKAKAKGKDREFSRGKVVLTARSKYQPRLSFIENGAIKDLDGPAIDAIGKRVFYNGVLCLAQVNFVAYEGVGTNPDGVTAYLNMVVSTNTGPKLSGGASAAEVFKGYVGSNVDEDPTGGVDIDDEIPF